MHRAVTLQLFLIELMLCMLPLIQRKREAFVADALDLVVRWTRALLPTLDAFEAGSGSGQPTAREGSCEGSHTPPLLHYAVSGVASILTQAGALLQAKAVTTGAKHAEPRRVPPTQLHRATVTCAAAAFHLSGRQQAADRAVNAVLLGARHSIYPSRLAALRPAVSHLIALPLQLLAPLLACGIGAADWPSDEGWAKSDVALRGDLQTGTAVLVCASVLDPGACGMLTHMSTVHTDQTNSHVRDGACGPASEAHALTLPGPASTVPGLAALRQAAMVLTDAAAEQQSVSMALLPLITLWAVFSRPGMLCSLTMESVDDVELHALLDLLGSVMSYSPVEVIRSAAHDAVHAVLDACAVEARHEVMHRMLRQAETAAPVIALQRMRMELLRDGGAALPQVKVEGAWCRGHQGTSCV
jgi:hypothetical protein